MSHLSNYGNDRLGLYVFQNVIDHIKCWTNLNLRSAHPVLLADKYFQIFPADAEPLWQVCPSLKYLAPLVLSTFYLLFNYFLS